MTEKIKIPEFENYIEKFGINRFRVWTEQEEDIIRRYYGIVPTSLLAKYLKRTIKAVHDKAYTMNVRAADNQKMYDQER